MVKMRVVPRMRAKVNAIVIKSGWKQIVRGRAIVELTMRAHDSGCVLLLARCCTVLCSEVRRSRPVNQRWRPNAGGDPIIHVLIAVQIPFPPE
jgi:hypothetical protein